MDLRESIWRKWAQLLIGSPLDPLGILRIAYIVGKRAKKEIIRDVKK